MGFDWSLKWKDRNVSCVEDRFKLMAHSFYSSQPCIWFKQTDPTTTMLMYLSGRMPLSMTWLMWFKGTRNISNRCGCT
jgi:hypothetical protein